MSDRILHIVTHDVPWPADFGGVMDLFYKIKTLSQRGVRIHLHCFTKNRPQQPELLQYCETVQYYPRTQLKGFSFRIPYIVNSRKSKELIQNLQADQHPVLLEGIHCSYPLYAGLLKNRKVLLRLHNTEYEYYHHLARHEKQPLKRWYFKHESYLLRRWESALAQKATIATVSSQDEVLYRTLFGANDIFHLPVFLPYTDANGITGRGHYCLYHGNLSINENEEVVVWLLTEIFNKLAIPFVIAGKNPSQKLEFLAHQHEHTCLVANPSDKEMHDMIAKAQVNILPSFNNTGVKLKLLNALYNGRHCLVNEAGVAGSGLESLCTIAEDVAGFSEAIRYLFQKPYMAEENAQRQQVLQQLHNNQHNADRLIDFFWKS